MRKFGVGGLAAALMLVLGACAGTQQGPGPQQQAQQQQQQQQAEQQRQRDAESRAAERRAAEEAERRRQEEEAARRAEEQAAAEERRRTRPQQRSESASYEGPTYRVVGVGDIMMGSNHPDARLDDRLTPDVDPATVIGADLAGLLRSADVTFGNLEGTIHDLPGPSKTCSNPRLCYVFRSPPHYADILGRLGFDVVALANNHAGDFLEPGRMATAENLRRVGIRYGGVASPGMESSIVTLSDGTRVGFIAFAPNRGTLSINNIPAAAQMVRALDAQVDMVLVSFHGGAEGGEAATYVPRATETYVGENRGDVYRFSHAMIDAGADILIGHGPHVPRAIEVYNSRLIAYSLGNFWTYGRFNLRGYRGMAPVADLRVTQRGELVSLTIHSVRQVGGGIPQMDPTGAAAQAVEAFTRRDFPEQNLTFHPDGRVTGPGIGPEA